MKYLIGLFNGLLVSLIISGNILAAPVDLSTFSADPGVNMDLGNGVVTFTEDMEHLAWYLYNDSFLVSNNATTLSFDYSLAVGLDNPGDYLVFEVGPLSNLQQIQLIGETGQGHYEFDFAGTTYRGGEPISIAWGLLLGYPENLAGTTASLSNFDIATAAPVPLPTTLLLFGSGLLGLLSMRRTAHKQ